MLESCRLLTMGTRLIRSIYPKVGVLDSWTLKGIQDIDSGLVNEEVYARFINEAKSGLYSIWTVVGFG